MKPKEYVKKYDLLNHKRGNFDNDGFIADLTVDFNSIIEFHKKTNWSYTKFKNCVSDIRDKFNSIANKSAHPQINEKMWSYFYATVVAPARNAMFGDPRENRRPRPENHARQNHYRDDYFRDDFFEQFTDFFEDVLREFALSLENAVINPFQVLDLPTTASKDEIKRRYKQLALIHHPDKGGNAETFRMITEAKERCLNFAQAS